MCDFSRTERFLDRVCGAEFAVCVIIHYSTGLTYILLKNIFLFVNRYSKQPILKWLKMHGRIQAKDCHAESIMNIFWNYIFAACFSLYKQLSCQNMYQTASRD